MNSKSEAPMKHIFNVENPNWVKKHDGTEAKSTMRIFVYIRSYVTMNLYPLVAWPYL
jgi:hypothetical protein